jgi:hypothetical protein
VPKIAGKSLIPKADRPPDRLCHRRQLLSGMSVPLLGMKNARRIAPSGVCRQCMHTATIEEILAQTC